MADGIDSAELARAWRGDAQLLMFDRSCAVAYVDGLVTTAPPGMSPAEGDIFLGRVAGTAWFARQVDECPDARSPRLIDLDRWERQAVTRAVALFEWHATTPGCDACGGATTPLPGGLSRACVVCRSQAFPRTDPAVIVAVLDDADRLLLAHQASWDDHRVSVLAGFVEAGESAEQASHREIAEESGLTISGLRFYGSQPWPYPRSLMLGFVARASGEVRLDGVELVWGRFYDRETVRAETASGRLTLPGRSSIAFRMITDWLDGCLPAPD